jgi:hypothetical protein
MRRRLVLYFTRKRCVVPDDLADETLHRVTRRLEEQGTIADATPARYSYIVAKFVLLEHLRDPGRHHAGDVESRDDARSSARASDDSADRERLYACLDGCLRSLDPGDRELILDYYRDEHRARIERRRRLAAALAVTANALAIRACRLRDRLEQCVGACRSAGERDSFRPLSSQRNE